MYRGPVFLKTFALTADFSYTNVCNALQIIRGTLDQNTKINNSQLITYTLQYYKHYIGIDIDYFDTRTLLSILVDP